MLVVADNNRARRKGAGSGAPLAYGLPTLSVAPVAAWYPVLVVTGYTGPLYRLVKVSDSTTRDVFAAAGSHIPDYVAIDAWAAGSAVVVDIWYDQTGNGWHKTQTTANRRPSFSATTARGGIRPIMYDTTILSSGTVNKQMNFGPITGLNRTPFGYHAVANQRQGFEGKAFLAFFNAAAPTVAHMNMNFSEGNGTETGQFGGFTVTSTGANYRTGFRARCRQQIYSVRNVTTGASGRTISVGGRSVTATGVTSIAMSDVATEGVTFSNTAESQFDAFGSAIWTTAPTADDFTAMDAWANALFTMPGAPTKNLVYSGNSLVVGWRSVLNVCAPDIFARAQGDDWEVWNMALGGRQLATEATNALANYNLLYNAARSKNILVVLDATNDVGTYASQAAAEAAADTLYNTSLINATTGVVNIAQGIGFSVVVPTIIARTGWDTAGPFYNEWFRLRYNQNVRDGAVLNNYKVSDRAADSRLSNILDTTYYDADRIHLTAAGTQVLASIDTAAILSW